MRNETLPTVRGLLAEPALRLVRRLSGAGLDRPIDWVHSSDLIDPTPFLVGGTMLLTTGTQFPADGGDSDLHDSDLHDSDFYEAYAERLRLAGVAALGFGLEVIRDGTPPGLVAACEAREITLVEVPYEVPFIALIRWVADRIAAREHERDAWTLRAQRAVSVAALTTGTLPAVAKALADQVQGAVIVLSSTGDVVHDSRSATVTVDPLVTEARRILGRGSRASADVALPGWTGFATAQTLGPRGALRGAIAVAGAGQNDVAMQAVVTSAVAIAEVLLRYGDSERQSERRLSSVIARLLLDGQLPGAEAVAIEFGLVIPAAVRVGILRPGQRPAPRLLEALVRPGAAFVDDRGDSVVFVAGSEASTAICELVDGLSQPMRPIVGLSAVMSAGDVPAGLAQAERVVAQNPKPGVSIFGESVVGLLDDLWSPAAENLARTRLAALVDEPGDLVACARLWLSHNGHWESAAREASLHRHTLKARIARVGTLLQLDLDDFAGRAELWALLQASRAV